MSQNSPKFLVALTIILTIAVASAGGFLVVKDKKISLKELFSKNNAQGEKSTQITQRLQTLSTKDLSLKPNNIPEETNLTKKLSQNLAATALLTNFDESILEEKPELIDQAFERAGVDPEKLFPLPEISDNEIIISDNNSKEAIEEYINNVLTLLKQKASAIVSSQNQEDVEMMQQAIETKDFSKIEDYLEINKKIIDGLKQITVPSSWAMIHKEQIALFVLERNIYQAVEEVEKDPLKAIMAIEKFKNIPELLDNLVNKMIFLRQSQQ